MFRIKFWYYFATVGCLWIINVGCQDSPCITPNGEAAVCKSLFSCPVIKNALALADPSLEKFILASTSVCGQGPLHVCCGTAVNYTRINTINPLKKEDPVLPTSPEAKRKYALENLLPSKIYCGMQHSDDYFHDYNTTETTVDELPWIMFVSCDDSPGASSIDSESNFEAITKDCDCSGVLISNRYVITSSNCDSAKWAGLGQREQYKNVSCTPTPFGDDCSEALAKTPFSEQIRHPNHTLLLLRLKKKIDYSDYIRPICLPLEEADRIDNGDLVITSTWALSGKVQGFVREKVNQTVTTVDKCSRNFEKLRLEVDHSAKYMCTEIEDLTTNLCKTDSGSPMMYKRNNNWFVGGILYAGYCLEKTALGTRLTPEVINWILENMKK